MSGGASDLIVNEGKLTGANGALGNAKSALEGAQAEIKAALQLQWEDKSGQEFHAQVEQFDKELQKVADRLNSNCIAMGQISNIALDAAAQLKAKSASIYGGGN